MRKVLFMLIAICTVVARIAARTLTNSTVLEFPGIGHFVTLASPCAQQVFASFLATVKRHLGKVAAARTPD